MEDSAALDIDSETRLLAFVEGHPLALRLVAALVNYLGSSREALRQVSRDGATAIELPKRTQQDRKTSIAVCLSLAYEMLDWDEQRLLYLIASSPGGIFTEQLKLKDHCGTDAPSKLAALRRWSLAKTEDMGHPNERSHMLSPIRSFVRQRWTEEHSSEAQVLTEMLLYNFGVMTAVIDMHSKDASEIPYMLSRFSQELPNVAPCN